MAIGNPNGIPFCWEPPVKTASDIESSPNLRISADGGVSEFSNGCLDGRVFSLVQASPVGVLPSLLVVPQSYKSGKLYAQLPNARVNHIPNNSMFGASGGVIPSGWTFSIGAASGVSLGYSASGQVTAEDGTLVDYIDFTFSGTATASGFLNLRPNASPSTISSVSGQSWNASIYLQLISGSVASISPTYQLQETTSGGTFIDGSNITGLGSLTTSLPLRRYNVTRDLNTSGTVVTCRWGHSIVSGTTYNYILRIASPQLENLSFPTSVIRTVSGAVYAPYSGAAPGGSTIASIADFTVSRNTTATRVNSSGLIESVASGVPRIDWFGQSCPGLLVEASGQNLCLQSTDTTTGWLLGANLTSGTINAIGVSGINLTVAASGNGIGSATGSNRMTTINATLTSGSTYTISFLVKKTGAHTIGGFFANTSGATQTAFGSGFDVSGSFSSGSLIATSPITNRIRRVEQWGTDVYRCSETFTMTETNVLTVLRLGPVSGVTNLNNSDVGTQLGFAAPQIELGAFPTSFIPTTSGTVSRAADVISASGALVSGLIGQTEGTVYIEYNMQTLGVEGYAIRLVAANFDNSVHIRRSTANLVTLELRAANSSVFSQTLAATGFVKAAIAYKSGDIAAFVNGTQAGSTSTSAFTFGASFTSVNLGTFGAAAFLNDRIRAAALYTTRLTNAQLAELTRL